MKRIISAGIILTLAGCMGGSGLKILSDRDFHRARKTEFRGQIDRAYSTYILLAQKYHGKDRARALTEAADVVFFYFYPDSNNRALQMEEEAYKLDNNGDYLYRLGVYAEASGKTEKAAEYYEKYVLKHPKGNYVKEAMDAVERIFPLNYREGDAAVFDGGRVTMMELEKEIESMPVFLRGKYQSLKGKKELLDKILERKLTLKEALSRGFHHSPAFQRKFREDLKDVIARAFYIKEIKEKTVVDSSEVDSLYRARKESFRIQPFVKARFVAWKDTTKIPPDSLFKKSLPRVITRKDSALLFDLMNVDTGKVVFRTYRDTLFAIKVEEIQKPGYKPLSEVYLTLENHLKNEKMKRRWESLLDSLMKTSGFRFTADSIRKNHIPDTIAVLDSIDYYITKDVFMNYLNTKVPPMYRKAFLENPDGVRRLANMIAQRELIYRYATVKHRSFLYAYGDMKRTFEKDLIDFYKDSILKNVRATQEELKKYYESHKQNYTIPATARIRRIVVSDYKTARKLYRILKSSPQKMDSLARIYTEIEAEKRNGGYKVITERTSPEYMKKISKFRPGKVYLFKYNDKWHLVKVNEYNPERLRSFEEVVFNIQKRLDSRKKAEAWKNHLRELKDKYHVKVLLKEDKKNEGN